jgi:hypothetical protein
MGKMFALSVNDFGDTGNGGAALAASAGIVTGHQHMHITPASSGSGHGVEGCAFDGLALSCSAITSVGHGQITFASFLSLSTRVATSGTLMPALRLGGSPL